MIISVLFVFLSWISIVHSCSTLSSQCYPSDRNCHLHYLPYFTSKVPEPNDGWHPEDQAGDLVSQEHEVCHPTLTQILMITFILYLILPSRFDAPQPHLLILLTDMFRIIRIGNSALIVWWVGISIISYALKYSHNCSPAISHACPLCYVLLAFTATCTEHMYMYIYVYVYISQLTISHP